MKAKQYAIIGELYKLRLIDKKLLFELSQSLAASHSSRLSKFIKFFDIVEHAPLNDQAVLLTKIYDSNIHENRFFKRTEAPFIVHILKHIKVVRVARGEFIYSANMPANNSRHKSLVYLVIEGQVNCLGERSLCFKSYGKGSYFGDIEIFCKTPRLFSVRAESTTTLAIINVFKLESALKVFRDSKMIIMRRSIQRLIKINIAMARIRKFKMVVRSDPFWMVVDRDRERLHKEIAGWLGQFGQNPPDGLSE